MWFLLLFISFAAAMENPAPLVPGMRKYSCCPQNFGYHFIQMNAGIAGREDIYLCDFEETKDCSDDKPIHIRSKLFKRLMIELASRETEIAQESLRMLLKRLETGRIVIDGVNTYLSHRDVCHRLLSHLPASKDGDWFQVALRGYLIRFFYLGVPILDPCIHTFTSILCQYPTDQEQMLFGSAADHAFAPLKPFPSLMALAARAIPPHKIQNAVQVLPADLKPLLFHQ